MSRQEFITTKEFLDEHYPAAARAAVLHRQADGAMVLQHGKHLAIYVAAGGGRSADLAVRAIGQHLASHLHATVLVHDLAPPAPGDPAGTIEFYSPGSRDPSRAGRPEDQLPRHHRGDRRG